MNDQELFEYNRAELIYNLTEEIELIIEEKNLNKKTLAEQIGKSQSYVSQILSGSRNMTLSTLADICLGIGVTPSEVFQRYTRSINVISNHGKTNAQVNVISYENWPSKVASACKNEAKPRVEESVSSWREKYAETKNELELVNIG